MAFFKGGRGFDEPAGTSYREQMQLVVRVGLEPGASELQVQRFLPLGHSAFMQTLNKLGIHLSGMSCYKKECLMKRTSGLCQIFMSSKLYMCYSC